MISCFAYPALQLTGVEAKLYTQLTEPEICPSSGSSDTAFSIASGASLPLASGSRISCGTLGFMGASPLRVAEVRAATLSWEWPFSRNYFKV
jgi:hypothetical protein